MRCYEKVRYSTKKKAQQARNEINILNSHNQDPVRMSIYKCYHCRKYHLTSNKPKDKKLRQEIKHSKFARMQAKIYEFENRKKIDNDSGN